LLSFHGGKYVYQILKDDEKENILKNINNFINIEVNKRKACDIELICNGAFSPLDHFMNKDEIMEVAFNLDLNGTLWSIPIMLPVSKEVFERVNIKDKAILRYKDIALALLEIEEKFTLNEEEKKKIAEAVYKTTSLEHPGVKEFIKESNFYLSGKVFLLNRPKREEGIKSFYYLDPKDTRYEFEKRGWKSVVAFQTRNPIHRAHEYITKCALEIVDGLFIHPLVGHTKKDDIPASVRMKCYEVLIKNYYNKERVFLSVLPAAMHYAGPREALHHMIIRKNYGATHMIIGRDHAGVGSFYGAYEAQEFVKRYIDKLEIEPLFFEHAFYCKRCESMATTKTCPHSQNDRVILSGTKVRAMLKKGIKPPKEFTREEVANILIEWAKNGSVLRM